MANPARISKIPLAFSKTCVYFANALVFFRVDVNNAKNIIIIHCPNAKENNSEIEKSILPDIVAIAIMLASIGEEQGLEAKAKNAPTKNGKTNKLPFLFWGIFFTIAGN